ncbi:MFS transporter [Sneathiella sp. HT1-7]|uniref:MFS transporter n=1 Tax=Sneathiella sp. HT1-7 TaxID=2887192 RepID=UPI001D1577B4|nr:MFS transporter [Sneathiella sp. HT1-7]MCC3303324.1 MFS transporter [Sneathiella sp. HT1-7]
MAEPDYSKRSAHLRMSLYYVAFFSVYGIAIPIWPRWLEHYISVEYVGIVMGAAYWAKLIFVPLTSWIADMTGNRKSILIALALFVIAALILLPYTEGWLLYALIWGAAGAALSSAVPLSDGLTLRAQQTVGIDFGKARLWGSLSFIAVSLLVGAAADQYGIDTIYVSMVLAAVFLLFVSLLLPGIQTKPEKGKAPFFRPLTLPNFPLFVVTVSLLLSTHAGLYGFSAIHWANLGYTNAEITLFWVIGVVAEIGMFAVSGRLIARFGATPMIAVAALGGVVRWLLLAVAASPILIGFAQTLHALTFALLYMSFIAYIGKRVPPAISASAQGLYDSLAMGVFFGIFTIAAGWLHQQDGSYNFLFMSLLSAIGLLLALILLRQVKRYDRLHTAQ